jgi:hypothetical protein
MDPRRSFFGQFTASIRVGSGRGAVAASVQAVAVAAPEHHHLIKAKPALQVGLIQALGCTTLQGS